MVAGGAFMTVAMILGIVVLVLWVLLPFAVFGTKARLERIEIQISQTNRLLEKLLGRIEARETQESQAPKHTGEAKPPGA
jgi:biopolymer transport protein ExbB/TolQ